MSPEIDDEKRLREHRPDVYAEFWRKHGKRAIGKMPELAIGFDPARHDDAVDAMSYAMRLARASSRNRWKAGVLFRWGSAWIGAHWSPTNKRLCVNLIPFVTVWVCPPGGITP